MKVIIRKTRWGTKREALVTTGGVDGNRKQIRQGGCGGGDDDDDDDADSFAGRGKA